MLKNKDLVKKWLLGLLIALLLVPLIQENLKLFRDKPLMGDIKPPENAEYNINAWFNGNYQQRKEKYINESFGFRNFFVRFNNQFAWTVFGKINARGVIAGKNNYLFEENYIKAYYGLDFKGTEEIRQQTEKLKFLHDTLKRAGKTLILIYAANKAAYYTEFFPDKYKNMVKKYTNYDWYIRNTGELRLNYIDFNKYFLEKKGKTKYPLFPQHGIHWSQYGTCIAADSIIKYIEVKRNIDLPNFKWDTVLEMAPYGVDNDLADGMNLMFKFKSYTMGYPDASVETCMTCEKPSVLVIADSYFWGMYNYGFGKAFENTRFWYYNQEVYPASFEKQLKTNEINLKEEILQSDIIIIMATPANLSNFGWGFISNAYNALKGIKPNMNEIEKRQQKIDEIIRKIKSDKEWLQHIEEKAKKKGISADSMVINDAIWLLENEK